MSAFQPSFAPAPSFATQPMYTQQKNCRCGVPASLAVSKSQRNPGKEFLACSKNKDDPSHCDFFEWANPQMQSELDAKRAVAAQKRQRTDESGGYIPTGPVAAIQNESVESMAKLLAVSDELLMFKDTILSYMNSMKLELLKKIEESKLV